METQRQKARAELEDRYCGSVSAFAGASVFLQEAGVIDLGEDLDAWNPFLSPLGWEAIPRLSPLIAQDLT
jgi:hypothetical protein